MRKQFFARTLLVILVLIAAGLACNRPTANSIQPSPAGTISEEELQRLQDQLEATLANSSGAITVTLTEQQINSIIATKMAEQPEQILTDPSVALTNGSMEVYGKITQAGISINMKMVLLPNVNENGQPDLEVKEMNLGGVPVPEEIRQQIGTLINQALGEYLANQGEGFRVNSITIVEDQMTVSGNLP